jgi:hypothetical protein
MMKRLLDVQIILLISAQAQANTEVIYVPGNLEDIFKSKES